MTARSLGLALLLAAAAAVIALPPSWLTIGLAGLAWVALAMDPRLGPLLAAAVVILALPYDRAADIGVLRVAGFPLRPHDLVAALGLLTSLPAIRRVQWTTASVVLAIFLAVGVGALAVGLLEGQAPRDMLRDVRWWGLYAGGLLLAGSRRPPHDALRAVFLGLTVFSALAIGATLLPAFEGGIKARALAFDEIVLRMQFGPTAFLLIPIAYFAHGLAARDRWPRYAVGVVVFTAALGLAVTRVSLAVAVVVAVVTWLLTAASAGWSRVQLVRGAVMTVLVAGSLVLALGVNAVGSRIGPVSQATASPGPAAPTGGAAASAGVVPSAGAVASAPLPQASVQAPAPTPAPTPLPPSPSPEPPGPLVRLFPELEQLLATTGGRIDAYRNALAIIAASPLVGRGLGALVDVSYGFGATQFDTPGKLPSVDNAYLTVGMKAGLLGIVSFLALMLWPAWRLWRRASHRARALLLPAWVGILLLTLTQSFAVIGYSPLILGILIVAIDRLPSLPAPPRRGQT